MARINSGSCVGVYYWVGNVIEVHNGRLRRARYGQTWYPYVETTRTPDVVEISHWNIHHATGMPYPQHLPITRVIEVRRTPDLPANNPYYCAQFRGIPRDNNILPGTCVGVWFRDDNGMLDVKNGRYLFWLDAQRNRHCVIPPGGKPTEIFYYHWIVQRNPQTGQITGLVPEIKSRTRVQGVFRTTLT